MGRGTAAALAAALVAAGTPVAIVATAGTAGAISNGVVISQVYGGGGNSGATLRNDFIELFNRGTTPVSVTGWTVQYASASGSSWARTNLSGSIPAGGYYLVQQAQGAGGTTALPAPDAIGTTAMAAGSGKVALVSSETACTGTTCTGVDVVDFVGFGGANFSESAPTATLSNTTAALRNANGCTETDDNSTDFTVGAPAPRNSASPLNPCGTVTPTPGVTVSPTTVSATEGGATGSFTVVLASQPTADVTFAVTPDAQVTTSVSSLTFTNANWNTAQSVTVEAVDDTAVEGAHAAAVAIGAATSTDPAYAGIDPADVAVTITDNDTATVPCAAVDTRIGSVQGSGAAVAITGAVTVQGVVVGDYEGASPNLRGFYLQDAGDADPATSDGIFVFNGNNNTVNLGQVVQVTGTAAEFEGQSQISVAPTSIELCGITGTVAPTDITFPVASPTALEAFEGMLVRIPEAMTVTEHFQLGRFGQVVVSSGGRLQQPTNVTTPGPSALALQAENNLRRLIIDDASQGQNPDPIVWGRDGLPLSATNTLRGGDTVTGATGVMTFTWAGNAASGNAYRLRPIGSLGGSASFVGGNPRPTAAPLVGGSLRVSAFNVLNYFVSLDFPTGNPLDNKCGPLNTVECRGADSAAELERQKVKLLEALKGLDADVLGLIELENSAGVDPLNDPVNGIVTGLNAQLGAGTYAGIDTGTIGTDTIKVAVIYQPAAVTPVGGFELIDGSDDARFRDDKNRPVLVQTFEDKATGSRFTVAVAHLKSKGSPCADVTRPGGGADVDALDGQGNCNGTRTLAAQAMLDELDDLVEAGTIDPDILVLGDLNAYAKEDPIMVFQGAGYTNLIEAFGGSDAYSYVFDGQWGYLDHALASPSMTAQVVGAAEWHINADEPSVLDYNTDFKSAGHVASLFATDPFRTSDHDPVVVGLSLAPRAASTTTVSSNDEPAIVGETVTITAAVASAAGTPTGTVQFAVNGVEQGAPVALVAGAATFTFTPPLGAHVVTAVYSGDTGNLGSSGTFTQRVTYSVVFLTSLRPTINRGAVIPVRVALVDASGRRISDAAAAALGACGVTISASGAQTLAPTCVRYTRWFNQFIVLWKTNRNGSLGPVTINVAVTAGTPAGTVTSTQGYTLVR